MKILRKLFWQFSREAQFQRMQREMDAYFSQATDRYDLERREREWDRRHAHLMRII